MSFDRDRFISVDGYRTRYWSLGERGHPVILLHGLGGYIETWGTAIEALASRHQVWALDLPGHGLSDKPSSFSHRADEHARFVQAFVDTLGIRQAHVVGHSMGAAIAAHLALRCPDRVSRLALVSAIGWGRECHAFFRLASLPVIGELLTRPTRSGTADAVKVLVQDPVAKSPDDLELDYQMAIRPGSRPAFMKALRTFCGIGGQHAHFYQPIMHGMATYSGPVLILWGRQDQLIPAAHATVAARHIRQAELHILEACGHLPMLEHPAVFNQQLQLFLDA